VFGDGTDRNEGVVREIRLTVAWHDGVHERSVERVTYLVDYASVSGGDLLDGASLLDLRREVQDALDAAEAR
jgi:hypothetical protein